MANLKIKTTQLDFDEIISDDIGERKSSSSEKEINNIKKKSDEACAEAAKE